MDKAKIEQQVTQIVGQYVKRDFSIRQDVFTNGWVNSFEATQITLQLEKAFNIKISDAEAKNLRTVESIASFVAGRLG